MTPYWVAVVLGVVEGLTEFIPVSSTGHLILTGHLLDFKGERAATFEIFIQLGAILAVVLLYRERLAGLLPGQGWFGRSSGGLQFHGLRGCLLLVLTTLPALVLGKAAYPLIKEKLFQPTSVAVALAVGAGAILAVEQWRPRSRSRDLDQLVWTQALWIGVFQCLSLWPGFSRAGATILGGLLCGLDRKTAAEYSFLAAVPVMAAATAVMQEPMIMSTLSSVTKRRALAAPLPGSVASSRMIRLTFSPAMVCGKSFR